MRRHQVLYALCGRGEDLILRSVQPWTDFRRLRWQIDDHSSRTMHSQSWLDQTRGIYQVRYSLRSA